jgi:hypothetical protein
MNLKDMTNKIKKKVILILKVQTKISQNKSKKTFWNYIKCMELPSKIKIIEINSLQKIIFKVVLIINQNNLVPSQNTERLFFQIIKICWMKIYIVNRLNNLIKTENIWKNKRPHKKKNINKTISKMNLLN